MAEAPGHLLGQLIGDVLERATKPFLQELASRHGFYLDSKGPRPGVREGRLVSLTDADGNKHDLDFVIERSGSSDQPGQYAAFIECAWRRLTKHSKAKAQEIQGAVLPLVSKWASVGPIPAAVVAGRWTRPSIKQLESCGFIVLQLDFDITVEAFNQFGVNIKGPEDVEKDKIPDEFWALQVENLRSLSSTDFVNLAAGLREASRDDFEVLRRRSRG